MYSRPASPRPTRSPVRGTAPSPMTTAVSGQGGEGSDTQRMSTYLAQPKLQPPRMPAQAQGRDLTTQNGQRGVVGRGGNFQPLGTAALNRLGGDPGAGGRGGSATDAVSAINNRPGVFGIEADTGHGAGNGTSGGGDIQTAIRGLKSQLGMPAGTDADTNAFNKMTGFGPNVQGMGPAAEVALAGANGGNPNFAPSMPPDVASRLRSMVSGGLQAPTTTDAGEGAGPVAGAPNIRPEIIRDVMQGVGRAGGMDRGGMAPFGGGGRGIGRGGGVGFMPGQPNPYAEILRQRLGAGAGDGGGMAGQYVY